MIGQAGNQVNGVALSSDAQRKEAVMPELLIDFITPLDG
jgi:hypothetical protein